MGFPWKKLLFHLSKLKERASNVRKIKTNWLGPPFFTQMLANTKFKAGKMRVAAEEGFCAATDIAEYLVKKGVAFRKAHEIVGKIVAYCLKNKKTLGQLSLENYRKFYGGFFTDIHDIIKIDKVVNARRHTGGTATEVVAKRIREIDNKTK